MRLGEISQFNSERLVLSPTYRLMLTSFGIAGDPFGPISDRWNVRAWPTVYVIDHEGVIRFKNIIGDELDRAVEGLIREQEAEARSQKVRESKGGIPKL
jgi:hypothetical protein